MNKELKALLEQINSKKAEVKNFANENKLVEAKAAKEELINLQARFNMIFDLEEEAIQDNEDEVKDKAKNSIKEKVKEINNAFVNAIKCGLTKKQVNGKDTEVLAKMSEGSDLDGGLLVPKDMSTKIKELRRSEDALENLVNVEPVTTLGGSRTMEKQADQTPFDNVDEEAEFPEVATPQFENVVYKVKKKGGILKVTRELIQDSTENILGYLRKWIAKKAKATRNFLIIAKVNEITLGKEKKIVGFDDLKKIFNVTLDPAISVSSSIVTNQNGFNWLDTQKDSDGDYILQKDPTMATRQLLFGKYPVVVIGNKTLKSKGVGTVGSETAWKHPFICGDLKEAITIFDRETLSIELSTEAGDLWAKDQTGIKVRERLDIQSVDEEAVVKGEVTETVTP